MYISRFLVNGANLGSSGIVAISSRGQRLAEEARVKPWLQSLPVPAAMVTQSQPVPASIPPPLT